MIQRDITARSPAPAITLPGHGPALARMIRLSQIGGLEQLFIIGGWGYNPFIGNTRITTKTRNVSF